MSSILFKKKMYRDEYLKLYKYLLYKHTDCDYHYFI